MPLVDRPVKDGPQPGLKQRAAELRAEIRLIYPEIVAARTGAFYTPLGTGSGEFHLQLIDVAVTGTYPGLKFFTPMGDELPDFNQMLLLYYFATSDGIAPTETFISFAELPGGRIYSQAFQGYSGNEIAKIIGNDITGLRRSCELTGGQAHGLGDAAYTFQILPKMKAQIVYWLGDEDFRPSCNILFEAASTHFLPIDGCAILGNLLAHKVIANYSRT